MHDEKTSQEVLDQSLLMALMNVADPQPADRLLEAVQVWLAQGASANAVDGDQLSAIHIAAAYCDDARVAQLLVKHGANVHAVDKNGKTPLHYAAAFSSRAFTAALIDAGASITALDASGSGVAHFAAINEDHEVLELFVELGVDLKTPASGLTPLQLALVAAKRTHGGNAKTVEVLVKAL
jgi:ankyrin repeat protein